MKKLLSKGDVIKTNPRNGLWGCAVVLTEKDKTEDRDPMCHIGITGLVFQHDYEFSELKEEKLKILEFERGIRLKPNEEFSRTETLIGVYSRKIKIPINIIGNIDSSNIFNGPLPFEPNYGLEITWPLCGNVSNSLGMEAIISWRRIHDNVQLKKEIEESHRTNDELMEKIRKEESEKRKIAKNKKNT